MNQTELSPSLPNDRPADRRPQRAVVLALLLLAAALAIRGFYDAGRSSGGHRLDYGNGVTTIPPLELSFLLWYLLFGLVAMGLLTLALVRTPLPDRLAAALRRTFRRPGWLLAGLCLLLLAAIWTFRSQVLMGAPITDDESTYTFIADTLVSGRVVNPLPGDEAFFKNQFVVLNSAGWFGKYPIGHPLLLAAGQVLGLRALVVPLISCAVLLLTWAVGRQLFGDLEACLAACLLLASPHFVWTGATLLSQPAAALCMLLGLWAMEQLRVRPTAGWALLGGVAWGYGVLVRPFPGGLFLVAAAGVFLLAPSWRQPWPARLRLLALAALPVALCAALFLWVNQQQTGGPLTTGYHEVHHGLGLFNNDDGRMAVSLGGAVLRENFWLFGWPASLLFLPFARGRRSLTLFWALIVAELAYRVMVPKTVVATTGPVYLTEIVPLLALASAAGMVGLARRLDELVRRCPEAAPPSLVRTPPRRWVVATALAGSLVAALTFVPLHLSEIHRSSTSWRTVLRQLEERQAGRALVFARFMVHPQIGASWAYYPPNPSPGLDDEVLFLRAPDDAQGARAAIELWRRRFPERTAWVFFTYPDGTTALRQLAPEGPAPTPPANPG